MEGEVGEKHLRLIIDHLSNKASSRGYPRNHYAPLCFRPLKIHPVSWPPSGASSWTDKCRRRESFLDLMTRYPTRASTRPRTRASNLSSCVLLSGFPFPFHFVPFAVGNYRSNARSSRIEYEPMFLQVRQRGDNI